MTRVPEKPPPCGKFDWSTRGFAPGLDAGAIRLSALAGGHLEPGGEKDAAGPLAEWMALAMASMHDKCVAVGLELRAWEPIDVWEVAGLLDFAYAACVRGAQIGKAFREMESLLLKIEDGLGRLGPIVPEREELVALRERIRRIAPTPLHEMLDGWAEPGNPEMEPGAAVCLRCGGNGSTAAETCPACGGTGETRA